MKIDAAIQRYKMNHNWMKIRFSDYFGVDEKVIDNYGAFNISVVCDLPLFIDPFLIFNSEKEEYKNLHASIIKYLSFLTHKSSTEQEGRGLLQAYFMFKEVEETWLGYSQFGNKGNGLGIVFARSLYKNLSLLFNSAHKTAHTKGIHAEKLTLIKDKVGKDNINDFTTVLIKEYLLEYTQTFARDFLNPNRCEERSIEKVFFNYDNETWVTKSYYLPKIGDEYVILVPKDILTRGDYWINRRDLISKLRSLPESVSNVELRYKLNNYLGQVLPKKPSLKEDSEALDKIILRFPEILDYYISVREESGDEAVKESKAKVKNATEIYLERFIELVKLLEVESSFYHIEGYGMDSQIERAICLKNVIENHSGYKLLLNSERHPISNEDDLRVAKLFIWNSSQQTRSEGITPSNSDNIPVIFKLGSNPKLDQFFKRILKNEEAVANPTHQIKIIFCYSEYEKAYVKRLTEHFGVERDEDFIIIEVWNHEDMSKSLETSFDKGKALIIGIANYTHVDKLPDIVLKDARDIEQVLCSPSHCGYDKANVRVLLDEQASLKGILEGLSWLSNVATSEDTAVIYFSGHGGRTNIEGTNQNFLIPFDCNPSNLASTGLSGEIFTQMLQSINCERLVIFFDSCHSGGTGEVKSISNHNISLKSGLDEKYYDKLASGKGRVIMASSRTDEYSYVLGGMSNSLFTHYLLDALKGKARTHSDGLIKIFDVFDYISENVPREATQHPVFKAHDLEQNFPIALFEGGKKALKGSASTRLEGTVVDKRQLRQAIVDSFTIEELEIVCFDIEQELQDANLDTKVNLDMIGGTGKEIKVQNLITYLDRRNQLPYLVSIVRRHRSGII